MEKADIIKEKLESSGKQGKKSIKSKKSKDPEPLTGEQLEKLPRIPKNWKWISHSEIATINPPKPDGNELLEVSFLPMPAVEEETGRYSLSETRKLGEVKKGYTGFIEGDVIFAKITPCMENGKVAHLEKLVNGIGFGSTEFHVSRPTSGVFGKYLFHYLVQQTFRKQAKRNMTGSAGQLRVPSSYFAEQPFPLAPLPEQRAIVSKIEQLFSELDNGISNLKLAQEQLKVYRQAVLKKAFEGELTKKWREQQTDLPDAKDLLEQIRKERRETSKVFGKKTDKIKFLTDTELAELPKLPVGWIWSELEEVIDDIQAGKSIKCDERTPKLNELGIVKVSSVSWGEFNENESKTCFNEEAFNADYIIHKNDFLFSRANTIELVGACVIVKSINKRLMLSDKILKIDFSQNHNIFYSLYYLRSVFGRKEIESLATGNQESMRNIGQDRIKRIKISICSLPEQQAIVQEIETRLSVCDKIEQDIETNLERAEALRQSILKKAFEGKLLNEEELAEVRGAEDWEPAEVLLEKIKAEKAENGKKGKQTSEQLKSIIQEDKGIVQQATLQAFEQIEK